MATSAKWKGGADMPSLLGLSEARPDAVEVRERAVRRMRRFWDDAARRDAAWHVDTTVEYSDLHMARFFDAGRVIVRDALDHAPVTPVSPVGSWRSAPEWDETAWPWLSASRR